MGRQHFTVGIHIHPFPFRLFQQQFQILQVVAGNEDARAVPYADVHLRDFRLSVGGSVGFIQKGHPLHTVFAGFQGESKKVIHGEVLIQKPCQRIFQEIIDFIGFLIENPCMAEIGGKPFQAVGNQFTEGADIFILFRKDSDFRVVIGRAGGLPESSRRKGSVRGEKAAEFLFFLHRLFDSFINDRIIKVGIGNGDEKIILNQMGCVGRYSMSFPAACGSSFSEPFRYINEYILQMGGTGGFPAHSLNGASPAACCFLTLIAKHLIFH